MAKFAIIEDGTVINIAEAENALGDHWIEWVDGVEKGDLFDGEVFTKPEPIVVVPEAVTQRQARLALLSAGLLAGVQPAIDNLPSPQKEAAQIEWDYASIIKRDSPLIDSIGGALGLTEGQIDALFIAADAI